MLFQMEFSLQQFQHLGLHKQACWATGHRCFLSGKTCIPAPGLVVPCPYSRTSETRSFQTEVSDAFGTSLASWPPRGRESADAATCFALRGDLQAGSGTLALEGGSVNGHRANYGHLLGTFEMGAALTSAASTLHCVPRPRICSRSTSRGGSRALRPRS